MKKWRMRKSVFEKSWAQSVPASAFQRLVAASFNRLTLLADAFYWIRNAVLGAIFLRLFPFGFLEAKLTAAHVGYYFDLIGVAQERLCHDRMGCD
jgi:hypothetical protein